MTILDVIFNGSKYDTFSRQSRQYFLSHEPSQLIGRAHLIGRNLVISLYDILLDDIFLENGSKFFHNTFPA